MILGGTIRLMPTITIPPVKDIEQAIDKPFEQWAHNCHTISLAIVKSGVLNAPARVARGWAEGVGAQHSWIVIGDPYDEKTVIIDPTLWSWDSSVQGIWTGTLLDGIHKPYGMGNIFDGGPPTACGSEILAFDRTGLSVAACFFLDMVEPLDAGGWNSLFNGPQQGWPAKEILTQTYNQPTLRCLVSIDILGMQTDINPQGLYF